jgi:pimeloyl-ACP methyl ester carboxylesterase
LFSLLQPHFRILAMRQRPLWPGSDPNSISDWKPLAADLKRFLDEQGLHGLIGAGHSFGAIHTLRLALEQPSRFSALILIDPVLFPPGRIRLWKLIHLLRLDERIHPLVKSARRRRNTFESHGAMFANYRTKVVFQRMSDAALQAYVDALGCEEPDGRVTLCYSAEWEARVYLTNMLADLELWRGLPGLNLPVLIIYGETSDTFWGATARRVHTLLPSAQIECIPGAGHLVPLEKPDAVYSRMMEFFRSLDIVLPAV